MKRGFHPARLERLDVVLRKHLDEGRLPGLVALVRRHDEEHTIALGSLAFGGARMQRDTIFRLASMTKPITAVAAMILVEECRLRLDDPVDAWLPELANRKVLATPASALDDIVPARRAITLRDLLTFRSGYGEPAFFAAGSPMHRAQIDRGLPLAAWPFAGTNDELLERLEPLPLLFQPGERWAYHLSAEILGVLVARASGRPLGAFLRERVFDPLGMKDTDFSVPEPKMARFATCYRADPATGRTEVLDEPRTGIYARPPLFEGGAGGLVSTATDLAAFGRMMLARGAPILSRAAVQAMTTDWLTPEQKMSSPFFPGFWEGCGWGLGVGVIARRLGVGRSVGSFGWDGAFGTSFWVDPVEDLIGVLLTQRQPDVLAIPPVVEDFWTSLVQALGD